MHDGGIYLYIWFITLANGSVNWANPSMENYYDEGSFSTTKCIGVIEVLNFLTYLLGLEDLEI